LAKILLYLSRRCLVQSAIGPNGGSHFDESALKRPLSDIVKAVDGNGVLIGCGMGLKYCSEISPCPFINGFNDIHTQIKDLLQKTSIS
jgi:DNA-binding IscR family transcriptional regulator